MFNILPECLHLKHKFLSIVNDRREEKLFGPKCSEW